MGGGDQLGELSAVDPIELGQHDRVTVEVRCREARVDRLDQCELVVEVGNDDAEDRTVGGIAAERDTVGARRPIPASDRRPPAD